ncbi:hypothetical protein O9929_02065 [Vibrio lentus]|nr:hypothetical protein [Vibrio lentus]
MKLEDGNDVDSVAGQEFTSQLTQQLLVTKT